MYVVLGIEPIPCSYQEDTLPTELPAKLQNFKGRIYKTNREWLHTKSSGPWHGYMETHHGPSHKVLSGLPRSNLTLGFWKY